MKKDTLKGLVVLIGGLPLYLSFGCFYLIGNISPYIASYLHLHDDSVSMSSMAVAIPIMTIFQSIFLPGGPLLIDKIKPWMIINIGGVILVGGVVASSFAKSLWLFELTYCLGFGIGIGLAYMVPIICGWGWFPSNKGSVSGMVLCGFGLGTFIFSFVAVMIVNPEGDSPTLKVSGGKIFGPDQIQSERAPKLLQILAIFWAVMIFSSSFLIRRKPDEDSYQELSDDGQTTVVSHRQTQPYPMKSMMSERPLPPTLDDFEYPDFKQAALHPRTWHLWILIVLSSCFGFFIAANFKAYGSNVDAFSDHYLTIVGAIGAVVNGISRAFWATLSDKIGFKIVYIILSAGTAVVAATLPFVHLNKALFLIWIAVAFSLFGGHFGVFPTICAKIFGPVTGGKVYPVLFFAFSITNIVGVILSMTLISNEGDATGQYHTIYWVQGAFAAVAFILCLFLNTERIPKRTKGFNLRATSLNEKLDETL